MTFRTKLDPKMKTMATSRIFWSKINIFFIYVHKDSPCSCDHTKLMVVGGRLHRRNLEKQLKKRNQSHLFCDVIDDVSPMSHASSESDLNFDNLGRLRVG